MVSRDNASNNKLRGGYYTPLNLCNYISKWISSYDDIETVLEPSSGHGAFLSVLSQKYDVTGVEFLEEEYNYLKNEYKDFNIVNEDFTKYYLLNQKSFDAIIGNPPYIRYHYMNKKTQENCEIIHNNLNIKFSKLSNLWTTFMISCIDFLKPGGKLGMVIPTELISSLSILELRKYLYDKCHKILLINSKEIFFEDAQQNTLIILLEKKSNNEQSSNISIMNYEGYEFLNEDPRDLFDSDIYIKNKFYDKWIYYSLSENILNILEKIKYRDFISFKNQKIQVGITSGATDYFFVNKETVIEFDLDPFVHFAINKSANCKGILLNEDIQSKNIHNNKQSFIVDFRDNYNRKYVSYGEENNYNEPYKCKIRKPWYVLKSFYYSPIIIPKRFHNYPRLIRNDINAYVSDSFYRMETNLDVNTLIYSSFNSLTALLCELEGRNYAGGVLELTPSEWKNIYIPNYKPNKDEILELHNSFMKESNLDNILKEQDKKILKDYIGLNNIEISIIQDNLNKLKNIRQKVRI